VALRLLEDDDLHAPHLLDVEVLGALGRLTAHGELTAERASRAVRDLPELDLLRYPHLMLLDEIWSYRPVLSAADATYVALARALGARLLTTDGTLSRSPNLPIEIVAP
jgi:predicted nucleic acid-binding protein